MKRIALLLFLLLLFLPGCTSHADAPPAPSPGASETPSPAPVSPAPSASEPTKATPSAAPEQPGTPPSATPEQPEPQEITLFLPNDSVDGFAEVTASVKKEPQAVVDSLIAHGALPAGTKVLAFDMEQDGKHIVIDLSHEFETALCSMGTSGEAMLTGSLVFTLLDCWGADTLLFTCEGRIVESGHVVYDFPLSGKK